MRARFVAFALCLSVILAGRAGGQGIGSRIMQRVQDKIGEKVDELTDSATDAAIARGENAVKCLATDKKCIAKVRGAGRQVVLTDDKGAALADQTAAAKKAGIPAAAVAPAPAAPAAPAAASEAPAAPPATPAPPLGGSAWLNYDFVPGDRVLFYDDFAANEVGDFPRRLKLVDGNMEVAKVDGELMLRSVQGGSFAIVFPQKLPDRFTVEAVWHLPHDGADLVFSTTDDPVHHSASFGCNPRQAWVRGNDIGPNSGAAYTDDVPAGYVTCSFTVDNGHGIKGYIDGHRTANAPGDSVKRTDSLIVTMPFGDGETKPALLKSLRVAAGGKPLYEVLSEKGRVATQGIFFSTGSDVIRPESTPTLKEIGDMLRAHPDLKLTIEGHTDNVGSAASNQTLSEKRAAAVRQYLITTYSIDGSRLASKGLGATKPAATNDTPDGRQQNRRVELVKG